MTGIVLALAGLACADGGQGTGAAQEPVAASFAGEWEGTYSAVGVVYTVEVRAKHLWLSVRGGPVGEVPFALVREGEGLVRMEMHGCRSQGVYRLGAGGVLLCVAAERGGPRPRAFKVTSQSILIALRPAQAPARRTHQRPQFRLNPRCGLTAERPAVG
ncbi:MAG TPA: hypothetical protein VFE78_07790 [Gemmataceae bacterium]|jgi:hypothetical protein|nr:hypothetical protein [Gemmataceae bacterium]